MMKSIGIDAGKQTSEQQQKTLKQVTEDVTYYTRGRIDLTQLQGKWIILRRATAESKGTDSGSLLDLVTRK